MPSPCPECGAPLRQGKDCQTIFNEFLVLEFTDPAFGEVHFLTVACFMIQHRRYGDQGLVWIEQKLRENLDQGISASQIRDEAAGAVGQDQRDWKVTRRPGEPPLPPIAWSMTIQNVDAGYVDTYGMPNAERYRALIQQWARVTVEEMQPWIKKGPR